MPWLSLRLKLIVKSDGKVLYTGDKKFDPMEVYKISVPLAKNSGYEVIVEGMDLQYSPSNKKSYKQAICFNDACKHL